MIFLHSLNLQRGMLFAQLFNFSEQIIYLFPAIHNLILSLKSKDDNLDNLNEPRIPDVLDMLPGEVNNEDLNEGRKTRDVLLEKYY